MESSMSIIIHRVLSKLFGVYDIIRGEKVYIRAKNLQDDFDRLRCSTVMGYELRFLVKRITLRVRYKNRFFGQKSFHLFEVHAEMPENAPSRLSEHMSSPLTFPNLLSYFSSNEAQVTAAVMAFIDIKMEDIK